MLFGNSSFVALHSYSVVEGAILCKQSLHCPCTPQKHFAAFFSCNRLTATMVSPAISRGAQKHALRCPLPTTWQLCTMTATTLLLLRQATIKASKKKPIEIIMTKYGCCTASRMWNYCRKGSLYFVFLEVHAGNKYEEKIATEARI